MMEGMLLTTSDAHLVQQELAAPRAGRRRGEAENPRRRLMRAFEGDQASTLVTSVRTGAREEGQPERKRT